MPSNTTTDQPTLAVLKPCPNPWCDNDHRWAHRICPAPHYPEWTVACGCGFMGPVLDSEARAITAWNTRTDSEPSPAGDLREALEPFAALADEWDRWQAKGSTSTPRMIQLSYGRYTIGLPQYQAARNALATHRPAPMTGELERDARLACPKCGSVNVLVARDMKSTRRCGTCHHSWLPAQDATHSPAPMAGEVYKALEQQMEDQDENLPSSIARDRGLVWLEGWFDLEAALAAHPSTQEG